jgi:transposase
MYNTSCGLSTAVTVVAETNGFNLIRNARQLVSYAGLDVVQKQSGTSVRGKAHISKKGNPHLRHCLHLPSFTAVKYNVPMQQLHHRIVEKQAIKMKGYVAVQRKMLISFTFLTFNLNYSSMFFYNDVVS